MWPLCASGASSPVLGHASAELRVVRGTMQAEALISLDWILSCEV